MSTLLVIQTREFVQILTDSQLTDLVCWLLYRYLSGLNVTRKRPESEFGLKAYRVGTVVQDQIGVRTRN